MYLPQCNKIRFTILRPSSFVLLDRTHHNRYSFHIIISPLKSPIHGQLASTDYVWFGLSFEIMLRKNRVVQLFATYIDIFASCCTVSCFLLKMSHTIRLPWSNTHLMTLTSLSSKHKYSPECVNTFH